MRLTITERPARARRLGLAIAALVVAGALAGCDASTAQSALDGHANNAGPGQVNSADNGASIPIGNGKTLLLYNDAYIGPLGPGLQRPAGTKLVNNVVVSFTQSANSINTYLGAGTSALFKPANPDHFYWLTNGVKDGSNIRFLAQERVKPAVDPNFTLVANAVITVPVANLYTTPSIVTLPVASHGAAWGEGILSWGDHWYIYGAVPDGAFAHKTLLARAPLASLATLSSWRYYQPSNGTWSTSQGAAGPLLSSSGSHVPYLLSPVVHGGRIISLATIGVFADQFRWASSSTPWGVVTVGDTAYVPPEAGQSCGSGGAGRIVYSVHPHDESDPAETLWSYSTTCWAAAPGSDAGSYAPDYRPRFFNVDLADAPTPCPSQTVAETRSFVRAAYTDMAGRTPATSEVDYWATEIATKGHCRSRLAAQLARDQGYLGDLIDAAYQQTLDRAPTAAARTSRMNRILDGTDSSTDLYVSLLASDEFWSNSQSSNNGFVTQLYQRLLGTTPSSGDLAYWAGRTATDGRANVARDIYQSADARTRRVQSLATRYLGRTFGGTELTYWRDRLGSSNDINVSRDLVGTAEYLTRAQSRFP